MRGGRLVRLRRAGEDAARDGPQAERGDQPRHARAGRGREARGRRPHHPDRIARVLRAGAEERLRQVRQARQRHRVPAAMKYEPFGWHHWEDHFFWSYQFRRALGETQEGGGAVSEVFQAASRMKRGDDDSWHEEWLRVAERNDRRGDEEEEKGHVRTAMNCWLRAADYYRSAEFWLLPDDPRRLATFDKCERASRKWLRYLGGEVVSIPYEGGVSMPAYFIKPKGQAKSPVLISFGGLDSFKDELWFMTGRGAVQRGIAVLMVDGPGQGGTLRRHRIPSRYDYEVPVGKCIDFLLGRNDVDGRRIAVSGSSL